MARSRLVLLPILVLLLLIPLIGLAKDPVRTEEGVVKKVVDGDTVNVVTNEGTKLKVRLYGIDAPEIQHINRRTGIVSKPGQPFGEEAYRVLEIKVSGKQVKVQIMDIRPLIVAWWPFSTLATETSTGKWFRKAMPGPTGSI